MILTKLKVNYLAQFHLKNYVSNQLVEFDRCESFTKSILYVGHQHAFLIGH